MSPENSKHPRKGKESRPGESDVDAASDSPQDLDEQSSSATGSTPRDDEPKDEMESSTGNPGTSPLEGVEGDDIDARLAAILEEAPDPVADALRQRDEYLDDLRRLQAEFENYRKRVARQADEATDRATAAVLERILPALDALDLAKDHAGEPVDATAQQLASALGQITSLLRDALAKDGLDRIDEVGVAFDPVIHDAVAHDQPTEGDSPGVVVAQVLRAGYRLKGRVVRPAMVKVRG